MASSNKKYVYVDPRLPVDPTLSTRDPAHPRNIVRNLASIEEQALADTVYDGPPPQRDTPLIEAYTASPSVGAPAELASAPVASAPPTASGAASALPRASHKRRPSRDAVDFRFLRIYGETVLLTVFLIILVLVLVIVIQNTQSVYVSFLFLPMIALMILFGLRMVIKTHLLD